MRGKLIFFIFSTIFAISVFPPLSLAQNAAPTAHWDEPFQNCWSFETAEMTNLPLADDGRGTVLLALTEGVLVALEAAHGRTVWRSRFGGEIAVKPLFSDTKLFLLNKVSTTEEAKTDGGAEYILRSLSPVTGLTLWQKNITVKNPGAEFYLTGGSNGSIFLFSQSGQIQAFAKTDGGETWRRELAAEIVAAPQPFGEKLIVATTAGIYFLNAASGETVSEILLPNAPAGDFYVSETMLVAGDRLGNINAFRLSDRKLQWKARAGAQIDGFAEIENQLIVSSNDGFVYALSAKTGDRIWKKRLSGRPLGAPLIAGDFALLQTIDGQFATILETHGGRTVNQLRFGDGVTTSGGAVFLDGRVFVPTNSGLYAFSQICAAK